MIDLEELENHWLDFLHGSIAKYNPDQPRAPKGQGNAGQWVPTAFGGYSNVATKEFSALSQKWADVPQPPSSKYAGDDPKQQKWYRQKMRSLFEQLSKADTADEALEVLNDFHTKGSEVLGQYTQHLSNYYAAGGKPVVSMPTGNDPDAHPAELLAAFEADNPAFASPKPPAEFKPTVNISEPVGQALAAHWSKFKEGWLKAPEKPTTEWKAPPLILPNPPVFDPNFKGADEKKFTERLKQFQDVILSNSSAEEKLGRLGNIYVVTGPFKAYKESLLSAFKSQTKPAGHLNLGVGDKFASFKILAQHYQDLVPDRPLWDSPTHEEYSSWGKKVRTGLPPEEAAALSDYQGSGYSSINSALRHGETAYNHHQIARLDSMFKRPEVRAPRNMSLVRRISLSNDHRQNLNVLVGTTFEDPAFFSAANKTSSFGRGRNLYIHVNVPKDHPTIYLNAGHNSTTKYEEEWLLPRNTKFRVDGVRYSKDKNRHHLYVTVLE